MAGKDDAGVTERQVRGRTSVFAGGAEKSRGEAGHDYAPFTPSPTDAAPWSRLEERPLQRRATQRALAKPQEKLSGDGLPVQLKAGVERLSGVSMDGVRVHRGSSKPAEVDALATAQGSDIHLGPGQEHHLPHEAWHVAQQRQGRVRGNLMAKGAPINDDPALEVEADVMGARAAALGQESAPGPDVPLALSAPSTGPVQRKLITKTGTLTKVADLGLAKDKKPGDPVARLVADGTDHYVTDPLPDFEAATIQVLEAKKYLLGEHHGDGTWDTRTAGWGYIEKMKEGYKGFQGQDAAEKEAVAGAKVEPVDQGLPLENMHTYALTKILNTRQLLKGYEDIKGVQPALIKSHLDEVVAVLTQYAAVGIQWIKTVKDPKAGTRPHHFMSIGLGNLHDDTFKLMADVKKGTQDVATLNAKQVEAIVALLQECVPHLMELIDTRPMGGGMFGIGQSKQGKDPIPNRAALTGLADGGKEGWAEGWKASLDEGNTLREAAMGRNVSAGPKPLLVQIGDAHVDNIAAAVGADAVKVKRGTDFKALTTQK